MARHLDVHLLDEKVGTFGQSDDGAKSFVYDPVWLANPRARPISLSLPLRTEPFDDRATRAFFGGLLPDDELRRQLARHLGVSANNEFALLEIVGRECAGAISIVPQGERALTSEAGSSEPLDDARLAAILRDLPRRPMFVGGELRLSLAGAQYKLAVCMSDGQVALPRGNQPSTHILKTPIAEFQETVQNELFCLRLAEQLGLRTASASLLQVAGTPVLCVERYDRQKLPDGRTQRIHQEDFCQALGIPADLKYQSEGGPNFARLFGTLRDHAARPASDFLDLLRAVLFGYLIGNADAHAKNFALLHADPGIGLAPLYDQMGTLVYEGLNPSMAMRIGSAKRFDDVDARCWTSFARDCGLAPAFIVAEQQAMASRLPGAIDAALATEPALRDAAIVARIVAQIRTRAARFR